MEEIMHDSYFLLILRVLNVVLITLAIAAWAMFYKRYKLIMAIAPITWLIHIFIYGTYRFIFYPNSNYITETSEVHMDIWTALILMHGIILLIISAITSVPGLYRIEKEGK